MRGVSMKYNELRRWFNECKVRLNKVIKEGDEQAIDDIIEEIEYVKFEMEGKKNEIHS